MPDRFRPGQNDPAAALGRVVASTFANVRPPAPPAGHVRFRSPSIPSVTTTWELNGAVIPSGYAAVSVTGIDGGESFTGYGGREPLSLRIPIKLDWLLSDRSVEADIAVLERIMGVRPGRPRAKPLRVLIEGRGIRHGNDRRPNLRWRLSEPQWSEDAGDGIYQLGSTGRLVRSVVVVTATAVNRPDPDDIDDLEDSTRRYVQVKKGARVDTLREIAKNSGLRWNALVELNPTVPRDPDRKLKPGTRIRVR